MQILALLCCAGLLLVDEKDNLIQNGGFEKTKNNQPEVWKPAGTSDGGKGTMAVSETKPKTGKYCLKIKGNAEWCCFVSNQVKVEKGKTYILTGLVRTAKGSGYIKFDYFKDGEFLGMTMNETCTSDSWTELTVTSDLEMHPTATHITATLVGTEGEFEVDFDDVSLVVRK